MSPKPPVFKPIALIRLLEKNGFQQVDQSGSHVKMRNLDNVTVIVPFHKGKDIGTGLSNAILRQAGIDLESPRNG
jgi:predicted RNA binding protein YcfA (HicA-like mRNA interferase family)